MGQSYPTTVSTYILNEDGTRTYLSKDVVDPNYQPTTVSTVVESHPTTTEVVETVTNSQPVTTTYETVTNTTPNVVYQTPTTT